MSHKDSVSLNVYEQLAEEYFHYFDDKPANADYERPATLSLLPDVTGKKVLDAGCAAGWYTKWLVDHGAHVTALDFSENMIEMTAKRVGDQAEIIRADLNEPLDFVQDQTFDLILSSLTLHYLKDWTQVMAEFHRILKVDGQFVFSVHHPFMDFTIFNREDYFQTELLDDEWNTSRGKVKVQFYRRPLHRIISSVLDAGFIISQV
jgi:SAM-dependent methyltransferase